MEERLISIIVPVYNTSKYLHKCIGSLVNQTYKNIEIIIVDDGSTDNSLDICQQYSKADPRVKAFSKKNGGVQQARKYGLSKTSVDSQFVMFVDSDDFLDVETLEIANGKVDNETDVVLFYYYKFSKMFKKSYSYNLQPVFYHDDFMNKYYKGFFGSSNFPVQLCAKLYRKSIFDDVIYYENYMGDDLCVNIQALPKARKFVLIDKPLYYYRFGGGTSRYNPKFLENYSIIKKVQNECANYYNVNDNFYLLINVESANVFFTYVKSYICSLSDYSEINLKHIEDCYYSYDFIINAVNFFKKTNYVANDVKIREHVDLICDFEPKKYADYVLKEIQKEKHSLKTILKKLIKSVI